MSTPMTVTVYCLVNCSLFSNTYMAVIVAFPVKLACGSTTIPSEVKENGMSGSMVTTAVMLTLLLLGYSRNTDRE